jgi:hypothetical protein
MEWKGLRRSAFTSIFTRRGIEKDLLLEEEQRALSENVLKLGKFLKRGGKWVRAEVLSQEGIEKGLDILLEEIE